jgi:hypothetical protein
MKPNAKKRQRTRRHWQTLCDVSIRFWKQLWGETGETKEKHKNK